MIKKIVLYCSNNIKYEQRALNNFTKNFLIKREHKKKPLQELLHPLHLYHNNIVPFDYDYYNWCCVMLLEYQKNIQLSDILLVMGLGHKYQIFNMAFWNHYQNQIHLRLYTKEQPKIISYYEQNERLIKQMIDQFVNKHKSKNDLFQILTEEEVNQQINNNVETTTVTTQETQQLLPIYQKSVTTQFKKQHIIQICQLLIVKNSQNTKLLSLILQSLTIQITKLKPIQLLTYMKLLNHICMVNLQKYNNKQFTPRSIKNIYKFQSFYYEELIPVICQQIKQFDNNQIQTIINIATTFPIKRRKFIKQLFSSIIINSSLPPTYQLTSRLQKICNTDKRMFKTLESLFTQTKQPQLLQSKN